MDHGFKKGQVDQTLFVKRDEKSLLIAQVYVDDMVGELNYFSRASSETMERWDIYILREICQKSFQEIGLDSKKHTSTLMSSSVKLSLDAAGVEVDSTVFSTLLQVNRTLHLV